MSNLQDIRQHVRNLRRSLTLDQQKKAAHLIIKQAINVSYIAKAKHIAVFLSVDGEINTRPLISKLWKQKKKIYLPILHPFSLGNLLFIRYNSRTSLVTNRMNILEPVIDIKKIAPMTQLDIILVPLVAFDNQGNRLGMGGGFYDRTLENWQQLKLLPIGIAHDCQYVNKLPSSSWDIRLPIILTPTRIWCWLK